MRGREGLEAEGLWGWEEEEEWVAGLQEEEEDTAGWWNLGNISWTCYQPWVGAEREAGQRVQSNFTVSSVIQTFRLDQKDVTKFQFTLLIVIQDTTAGTVMYIHSLISVYFMNGCHITVQESCIALGEEKTFFRRRCPLTHYIFGLSKGLKDSKDVGERGPVFTAAQEAAIVNLSLANNSIRQREIQSCIMRDNTVFTDIQQDGLSASACVLRRYRVHMKQLRRVAVERDSQRIFKKN